MPWDTCCTPRRCWRGSAGRSGRRAPPTNSYRVTVDVDGTIGLDPAHVIGTAVRAEAAGYDGMWTAEVAHDPFLPLALAAEHTRRIQLGTGIAVAFARNPMTLAVLANDLQTLSQGRFLLGLGSQIKPHIEKRFSMPWSHPAPRMRELVLAVRAIWASWADGSRLAFRGEFYRHTLMTPMFDPGPNPYGNPKVFLAAVGEKMAEVEPEGSTYDDGTDTLIMKVSVKNTNDQSSHPPSTISTTGPPAHLRLAQPLRPIYTGAMRSLAARSS